MPRTRATKGSFQCVCVEFVLLFCVQFAVMQIIFHLIPSGLTCRLLYIGEKAV